jgi:hypothetical protein
MPWRRGLVVLSPPATEETGAVRSSPARVAFIFSNEIYGVQSLKAYLDCKAVNVNFAQSKTSWCQFSPNVPKSDTQSSLDFRPRRRFLCYMDRTRKRSSRLLCPMEKISTDIFELCRYVGVGWYIRLFLK